MPPRPPTSTLFPYTTLFRSTGEGQAGRARVLMSVVSALLSEGVPLRGLATIVATVASAAPGSGAGTVLREVRVALHRDLPGDRKSTRLNSSHMSISYAVFCL